MRALDARHEVETDVDVAELAWAPGSNGFAPADFDGDGAADASARIGSYWKVDNDADLQWDVAVFHDAGHLVPADYDGDGKADLSVKDYNGVWRIDYAADGFESSWDANYPAYGTTSTPVPADYDGDGRADLSVKDGTGTWFIDYAYDGFGGWNVSYGGYGDNSAVPVPADYDGDGKADLSVKDGTGTWYIDFAAGGFGGWNAIHYAYGEANARPAPADYDGDGKADLSVKDWTGTWYIDFAADGFAGWNAQYGGYGADSWPIPADYDGDGKADLSVGHGGDIWLYDFALNGFGAWDVIDPIKSPSVPAHTLTQKTTSSLTVRINATGVVDRIVSHLRTSSGSTIPGTSRTTYASTDTRQFTGLSPNTTYCVYAEAWNTEGFGNRNTCFTTDGPTSPPPPQTGSNSVQMNMQAVPGPITYFGTWGPISGARATRLRLPSASAVQALHILKQGRSNTECFGPNHSSATVTLTRGGSIDAAGIASIYGGTAPAPGSLLPFTACATFGNTLPSWVSFELDWTK